MKRTFSKYVRKLFSRGWVIGITRGNIGEMIRTKSFNPDIRWIPIKTNRQFYADPFIIKKNNGDYDILFEDYSVTESYGRIAVMTVDEKFRSAEPKVILDTKSHLSYPFIFQENGHSYVFPESARVGKLSCYEYDPTDQSMKFVKDILDVPLLDGTILKHNNKFWLFGIVRDKVNFHEYRMHVYFSDQLLGPYTAHPQNPIKNSLNGTRAAGNFLIVDGTIYRPTQNCENIYGESITINKLTKLTEQEFEEEVHMDININRQNKRNFRIHTIHTINVLDNMIVVDGIRARFSPLKLFREIAKKKSTYLQRVGKFKFLGQLIILKVLVDIHRISLPAKTTPIHRILGQAKDSIASMLDWNLVILA